MSFYTAKCRVLCSALAKYLKLRSHRVGKHFAPVDRCNVRPASKSAMPATLTRPSPTMSSPRPFGDNLSLLPRRASKLCAGVLAKAQLNGQHPPLWLCLHVESYPSYSAGTSGGLAQRLWVFSRVSSHVVWARDIGYQEHCGISVMQ